MIHPVTQYALDAVERKIIVGQTERSACLRHLYDLARAGQLDKSIAVRVRKATKKKVPKRDVHFQWMFDEDQATFVAITWFGYLRHVEGKLVGQPIELIPAHVFDVGCIFGWTSRKKTITRANGRKVGVRRFNKAFVTEGRKNAKTTRIAGISLYMLVGDQEDNPAIFTAAYDKKQARVCYNFAMRMAEKSPDIRKRLKIGKYEMNHLTRGGEMTAFSGETKNKDSFNPSCSVVDEYWSHPTSEIYDAFDMAQGQRLQPLIFIITTAGKDIESPCYKELEYCKSILDESVRDSGDRVMGDRYFVMVRELDKKDAESDPRNWIKANPLLCRTQEGLKEFADKYHEVMNSKIPEKIREFRTKKLNKWISGGRGVPYMDEDMLEKWDRLAVSREAFAELVRGKNSLVGVDLSKSIDLTACDFVFSLTDNDLNILDKYGFEFNPGIKLAITAHGFLPEDAVQRHEHTDKIPYRFWAEQGWLTITDGGVTDSRRIEDHIEDYEIEGDVHVFEVCVDPYQALSFTNSMISKGYSVSLIDQWMKKLSEPTKFLRELVMSGQLVHDGSPLLRSHVVNALQIMDSKENIMITKKNASDTKRVDLLAAGISAIQRFPALVEQEDDGDLKGLGF